MTKILKFWRKLPKETKKAIMKSKNITAITYADIEKIYLESL